MGVMFGSSWVCTLVLLCLGAADTAFLYMGAAMYFIVALSAAALRTATRTKLGISGDMVSDACACCFAFPWAIGQMAAEDFTKEAVPVKAETDSSIPNVTVIKGDVDVEV